MTILTQEVIALSNETSLNDWYTRWAENRATTVAETRLRSDVARYDRYIAPRLGSTPVLLITPKKVSNWIDSLKTEGVGDFTSSACVLILRQILDLTVEAGVRRSNPVEGILVAGASGIRKREESEILTSDEFERLVTEMTPHFQPLVLMGGLLGVAWSEAMGLQISDIDFNLGFVNVGRCLAVETNGKIEYRDGKPRRIDMPERLTASLAKYVLGTAELRARADQPWVFLSPRVPKHPLRPNWNKFYLRPALSAAGLNPRTTTFHTLRHTAAAQMLQNGVELAEVSRVLGHSSIVTTKRYYSDFIPKTQPIPAQPVEFALNGGV